MAMPVYAGMAIIDKAFRELTEEKLYQRWIAGPQFAQSFDDFKRSLIPPKFKDDDELLKDTERILNGGRQNGNI